MPINLESAESNVVPLDPLSMEISEDLVAMNFARIYADKLRYDHDAGRWYEWDGIRWRADKTERGFHYAREISRRLGQGKKAMCKASVASGAERFCRSDPKLAVTSEEWDQDIWKLGTPGGVVDLKTGRMGGAEPVYRITKLTAVAPAPGKPARWLSFLGDATGGDQQVIDYLQEWCGYSLSGDTREHALMFAYGGGGNGKSVFINTFTRLLGDYAVTAAMETFTASKGERHSTDVAMLQGARLVTASETEEGRSWAEARIKQMTGADPITARFMRRDNFTYVPQFKLTIVGNHAPVLHSVDEAMRRRFRILPFDRKPAVPDRQLEDKLTSEWPQILHWMIQGCLRWQMGGLSQPAAMLSATDEYFDSQDLLGRWIDIDCQTGRGLYEEKAKLFASWAKFARDNGEDVGTSRSFYAQLKKRGFRDGHAQTRKKERTFIGIAVNVQAFDDEQGYPI